MFSTVIINPFVLRQTENSPFSYFQGTWEELCQIVSDNLHNAVQGYRPHVMLVSVPADRFVSGVVELTEGMELISTFVPRRQGEEPRKTVAARGPKTPAKYVEIVCYHSSILEGDAAGEDCWEIISINAAAVQNEPMPLESLLYNMFGGSGGTPMNIADAQEALNKINESWFYWRNKAMHAGEAN
jgi:hypothetical protein